MRSGGHGLHSLSSKCWQHAFEVGLEGEQVGRVRGRGAEVRGVGHSKEASDHFAGPAGAVRLRKERQDVGADKGAWFRGIMRGAGDAHGADGCGGKPGSIRRAGGALQDAPLAAQGAPGAPAQEDVWMLFEITAAAVPTPEAEESGARGELNEGEPRLLLRRHQAGGSPTARSGQAVEDKLLLGFPCCRGRLREGREIGGGGAGVNSHGNRRDGEVGVTASLGIEATEWNGRRSARCFGEGDKGVVEGDNSMTCRTSGVAGLRGDVAARGLVARA